MLNLGRKPRINQGAHSQSLIPAAVSSIGVSGGSVRPMSTGVVQDAMDQAFLWSVLALLFLGLIMVYSATVALPAGVREKPPRLPPALLPNAPSAAP